MVKPCDDSSEENHKNTTAVRKTYVHYFHIRYEESVDVDFHTSMCISTGNSVCSIMSGVSIYFC